MYCASFSSVKLENKIWVGSYQNSQNLKQVLKSNVIFYMSNKKLSKTSEIVEAMRKKDKTTHLHNYNKKESDIF